ncbi:UNVERIFIED_CONTAM: hypothetical protein GTU68_067342, partial [Idotea baltica]|nr:hypothetical protein [Idotea baltica]
TRPGADAVSVEEEWTRVAPAIEAAVQTGVVVSIDTRKAEVARRALNAGARLFNDVSALTYDDGSLAVAHDFAEAGGAVTMQKDPQYDDVLREVYDYLFERVRASVEAGISPEQIIVDPGIGFGKTLEHNLELMRGLGSLHDIGCPILLGASRKRFIGTLTGEDVAANRVHGSVAAAQMGIALGAHIVRVHDVKPTVQALAVWSAVQGGA